MKKRLCRIVGFLLIVWLFWSGFSDCLPNTRAAENFVLAPYAFIAEKVSGKSAYSYVDKLAREEWGGRQSGSEGCNKAADWIAQQFHEYGLQPYRDQSYFQPLEVPYFNLTSPLVVQYREEKNWINLHYRDDFIVFPYSGQGKVSGDCVFVGYGVYAPELDFDEYENVSVTNKTVCFLWHLPVFLQDKQSQYSYYRRINTAYQKGASSVVILLASDISSPIRFDMKMAVGHDAQLPVILASHAFSSTLLHKSGSDLDEIVDRIDSTKTPQTKPLQTEFQLEIHYEMEKRLSNNVIGYIPAVDPRVRESILITSHYDGLGTDQIQHQIYPGANDNASSTGCIMEIARNLSENHCLPSVNLVFIAFTGEEVGLVGSRYYVSNPLFPLGGIKAVINSEEIGTCEGVNIAGTSRSIYPELSRLIVQSSKYLKMDISIIPDLLYPGSDHYPFHERDIPSVCFAKLPLPFGYPEYHLTTDTIEIICPESLETFCQLLTIMVLSYSEASFIDFSEFPSQSQSVHPFLILKSRCYIPSGNSLTFTINHEKIIFPESDFPLEMLILFLPLDQGQNDITFEVVASRKTLISQRFRVLCDPDWNLRADFNQDWSVNVVDLQLMAQKWDNPSPAYHSISLYDLNQDRTINSQDTEIFSQVFGYSG